MVSNQPVADSVEDAAEAFQSRWVPDHKGTVYFGGDAGLEGAHHWHSGGRRPHEHGADVHRRPRFHGGRAGPVFQGTDEGRLRGFGSQPDHRSERGVSEREVGLQEQIHAVRFALAPGLVLLEGREQDFRVDRAGRRHARKRLPEDDRRQPFQAVQGKTGQVGERGFGWRIGNEEIAGLPETTLAVNRGDAVFFHDQTLHSSWPNTTGADRWSFISTYRDASVRDDFDGLEASDGRHRGERERVGEPDNG